MNPFYKQKALIFLTDLILEGKSKKYCLAKLKLEYGVSENFVKLNWDLCKDDISGEILNY